MDNPKIIESIKIDIALALGFDPEKPPLQVNDKDTALILGVKAETLSVWRSTGRYGLPYLKIGRLIKYRISDLAEFLANSIATKTA